MAPMASMEHLEQTVQMERMALQVIIIQATLRPQHAPSLSNLSKRLTDA